MPSRCRQLLAIAGVAFATCLARTASADVDRNSPIVSDNDPRLLGNYRASGRLITTAPCAKPPCKGPEAGAPGTREVAPVLPRAQQPAPSLVSQLRTALTKPVHLPPLVNAALHLPADVGRGVVLEGWDVIKGTVGLVANTDAAGVRVMAGLSTGNLGAAQRALTGSQVGQMVKSTVQNVTTSTRMVSAYATGNDQALVNATLDSPMFPLMMQGAVEAPRIVNTIRHGTPEERAQLISQGGELYGRLSLEAALFAVPGGAEVRAPSLAARTTRLTTRLEEAFASTRQGLVNRAVATKYGPTYWKKVQAELDQLVASDPADIALRQRLMSDLSEKMNVPSLAENSLCLRVHGGVGGGNCGFSAVNSVDAFAHGGLSSPVTYPAGTKFDQLVDGDLFRSRGLVASEISFQDVSGVAYFLGKNMRDGQMALLTSFSDTSGHATVVVKMGDNLYNVNNQGWAPGAKLQTLAEWNDTWVAHSTNPSSVYYDAYITPFTVGGK